MKSFLICIALLVAAPAWGDSLNQACLGLANVLAVQLPTMSGQRAAALATNHMDDVITACWVSDYPHDNTVLRSQWEQLKRLAADYQNRQWRKHWTREAQAAIQAVGAAP